MSIEAMRQALDALEEINELSIGEHAICLPAEIDTAIDALRAAIAQVEQQEPVAWVGPSWLHPETRTWASQSFAHKPIAGWIPLYTAPPRREWVGLTDEEVKEISLANRPYVIDMVRALEQRLKEKNGG
jgi:hypothetical protein